MKKKIISLALVVAMIAIMLTSFTMAYFTDTDSAENVFTVGNIDIKLHEKKADGTAFEDVTNVMPGMSYDKVVTVENVGNNAAYVRVTIVIPENMSPVWNENTEWEGVAGNPTSGSGTYVFTLKSALASKATTSALLNKVTLNADVTELDTAEYKVQVNVEAIQADSFGTPADAYTALDSNDVANKTAAADEAAVTAGLSADDAKAVTLTDDIKSVDDIMMVNDESTLDGNGKTLTKNGNSGDTNYGVNTVGGTIKNIEIFGARDEAADAGFRAIGVKSGLTNDLVVENAVLNGTYALSVNGANDKTVTVKNTDLQGWVSFEAKSAEFTNCKFTGQGTAPDYLDNELSLATVRPYADTVMTGCSFNAGYTFSAGKAGLKITLNECTVGGVAVNSSNFTTLFNVVAGDPLRSCTVVVDGATVTF